MEREKLDAILPKLVPLVEYPTRCSGWWSTNKRSRGYDSFGR